MDKSSTYEIVRMIVVAFIGGSVGYFVRLEPTMGRKSLKEKLKRYVICVFISMFLGYISYEVAVEFLFENNGVCAAFSGLCSFTGTELLVALSEGLKHQTIEKLKVLQIERKSNINDKEKN